ncbi:MAG: type II toxin-antitoxin system death-on-curing family toxin [Zhengella sp.]|uniref:type II toxin-antitoxin system death-on-curing family toxin n=1 Tax=Zhengella sp. TaxID=2282762 RepID=UPI001D924A2E|nr:type II toxin-antitoxin system death-on-curing family toxin [Notoacmeibacter sp.]MCC0026311.1 type II toxin-antitoxin system death-on-curing family toxin [Brucellaceae bacterium]
MTWNFVDRDLAEAAHREQLRRHGGGQGLRDANALESALDRPRNKAAYGDPDVFELAAAYLFGMAKNHPFVDGNKRTALVVCGVFLLDNGYALTANDNLVYELVMGVAAGEIDEDGARRFLHDHTVPIADLQP